MRVCTLEELQQRGGQAQFKLEGKLIALFSAEDGQLFATDNRCPHEGYPLSQGTVDCEHKLTCNWHNWKFDLKSGDCVSGGDQLVTYPVEIVDGVIYVDLNGPSEDVLLERALSGLSEGMMERDIGRIARELTRTYQLKGSFNLAVNRVLEIATPRLKYGFAHGYACLADTLSLHDPQHPYQLSDFEDLVLSLSCAVEHIGMDATRYQSASPYLFAEEVQSFDADQLRDALEAEDEASANAQVRAWFDAGESLTSIERPLVDYVFNHFLAFGHGAIYLYKGTQLLRSLSRDAWMSVLLALVRSLINGEREELLPEFSSYVESLETLTERDSVSQKSVSQKSVSQKSVNQDAHTSSEPSSTKSAKSAMRWVINQRNQPQEWLFDALLSANAQNLLLFSLDKQEMTSISVGASAGWLNVTHAITFALAGLNLARSYPHVYPQLILQCACFYGRNVKHMGPSDGRDWSVGDRRTLWELGLKQSLDSHVGMSIHTTHYLKTTIAIFEELPSLSPETTERLLAGLNRYLSSPLKQKHRRRSVYQALQLLGVKS